jgi:hypothetical protein
MATVSFFIGWEIRDNKEALKIYEKIKSLPEKNLSEIGITEELERDVDLALERGKSLIEKWKLEGILSKR